MHEMVGYYDSCKQTNLFVQLDGKEKCVTYLRLSY